MVLKLLKRARESAGITQVQLAERLGQTQSLPSAKSNAAKRRLRAIVEITASS